jgi:hypothetical protein
VGQVGNVGNLRPIGNRPVQIFEAEGPPQPLIVYLDGRSSYPAAIPVANADATFTVASAN